MAYFLCLRGRKFRRLITSAFFSLVVLLSIRVFDYISSHQGDTKVDYGYLDGRISKNLGPCREQRNIVYIKMFKCASETLVSVFNRFGYMRNLSFVLPVGKKIYLGWPYPIKEEDFRPRKTGYSTFNILTSHSVYNEEFFENLMPPDTVYITSVREPFSQFKSTFHYYEIQKIAGIPGPDPITTYLHNVDKYEAAYQSHSAQKRFCVPDNFTMTRNLMSFSLGFPLGYPSGTEDISNNEAKINKHLEMISKRFKIVLIVEHFIESVVLMRRNLCWSVKDVLYYSRNVGNYTYKAKVNQQNFKIYRDRSKIDFKIYDHFNKTLWKQISKRESDFFVEVNYLKDLLIQTFQFCNSKNIRFVIPPTAWNKIFSITQTDCSYMKEDNMLLLKERYENLPPPKDGKKPSRVYC